MRRGIALGLAALAAVGMVGAALLVHGAGADLVPSALAQTSSGPADQRGPGGQRAGLQTLADRLGMTPDQIRAERQAGRSLADIAAARGVDQAALVQTITNAARTRLNQRVADGQLTQQQADALVQVVQAFAPQMLTRADQPGSGPRGPGRRPREGGERQ